MDDLLCEQSSVDAGELVVVNEQQHDIGSANGFVHFGESDVIALLEFGGQAVDVRLDRHDVRVRKFVGELPDDLPCRALAQVVDVRLECQAECRDLHILDATSLGEELIEHVAGLRVVDLACGADQ